MQRTRRGAAVHCAAAGKEEAGNAAGRKPVDVDNIALSKPLDAKDLGACTVASTSITLDI